MNFPYHTVPDGSVFFSHHYIYAVLIVFLFVFRYWDDYRSKEPWLVIGGIMLSLFAWYHLWATNRPVTGAILTMAGLALATAAPLVRTYWRENYSWKIRASIIFGLLVAWDDILQHAFGTVTPLDWAWKTFEIYQYFP